MNYGFGVDLGGTTVKIAYFDETGRMIEKWEIPTDKADSGSHILPDIAKSVNSYITSRQIGRETLLGVGIGVPGPVNSRGIVNRCINLGWGIVDIPQILGGLTGLPVAAGNDANMAALGESWKGGGQGCDNMVFATLGTGVGGGIIIDGKPLHGVHGSAGEIGHINVNRFETEPCGCGNHGCAEQYCSATGVVRIAKQFLQTSAEDSSLRQLEELTCRDVFDAAKAGDDLAKRILDKVFQYMGQFLAAICCTVDPEVVVLGGGVSKAGQYLIDGAKHYFDQYIFHAARSIRFTLATLGNDAGAYGAFRMILNAAGK